MQHILNPTSGEVRYVTLAYARYLRSYGWRDATFAQWQAWNHKRLMNLGVPVNSTRH